GQRLAVDEAGIEGRREEPRSVSRPDLDEIAKDAVVADLEAANVGLFGVARLKPGDDPPALVAEGPRLVEFGAPALPDKTALTAKERQGLAERARQPCQPARQ